MKRTDKPETRTETVMVRMLPEEKRAAEKKARAKGLSLSAWLRMLAATATALVLAFASPASALDRWTWQDTAWEAGVATTLVLDWAQTRDLAWRNSNTRQGDRVYPFHNEGNPILGRRPSMAQVNAYFAGAVLTHAAIAVVLPANWRRAWQASAIGVEVLVVNHNAQMSLRVRF